MTIIEQVKKVIDKHPAGVTTDIIKQETGIPKQQIRNALGRLGLAKKAHCTRINAMKTIWYPGRAPEEKLDPIARPDRINKMAGTYCGTDLKSPPVRPGSLDAYRIPSRGFA